MTSFQTFRDFRKEVTCGFSANLTYLVEFPGRAPERQFINISGKTHEAFQNTVEDRIDFSVISDLVSFMRDCGVFEIGIGYTEISWGNDLEKNIYNFVRNSIRATSQTRRLMRLATSAYAIPVTGIGLPILFDKMETNLKDRVIDVRRSDILTKLSGQNDISAANLKLDALLINRDTVIADARQLQELNITFIGLTVGVFALFIFGLQRRKSFIIFNDESKRRMDISLRRSEILKYIVGVSFVVGTGASLAATFIYNFFS